MAEIDPHQITTCPYNTAHQVEHYRMHIHLQKCRKQYPNCKKVTCPFDATHIVNDVELDYHVKSCSKRAMLDHQLYKMDDDYRPVVPVQLPPPIPTLPTDENWDDENVVSYKPELAKTGNHIIMKIKGATPSERRAARKEAVRNYRGYQDQ